MPQNRPNLIYIFADQLRYQACGFAGDAYARTPHMDRLATQGTNFANAVSCSPVCAPYRASLLTGKYQSSHGMVINELRLNPNQECFGHVLTKHGYRTAYIGKWHLWANQLGHHHEIVNAFTPPGPYRLGFDGYWAGYNFNHEYYGSSYFEDTPEPIPYGGYEPDVQTDMAIRFMRESAQRDAPFALFLSWGPPHDPWDWNNVPDEYADLFRDVEIPLHPNFSAHQDPYADTWGIMGPEYRAKVKQHLRVYYAQTANLDWNLGRMLTAIDEVGISEDTILVFTSDHGEMFGSHGRRAKNIFYEEAARIPFLVRWTGHIPADGVSDVCLNTPDIMPTLLALMNLPFPEEAEGMDLSHWALGHAGPEPEAAFLQGMGTTAAWKDGTEWRALRDKQYTYAIYRRDGKELLFDNLADAYQMENLANQPACSATLKHYREMLQAWMKEQHDTFETCTWYRDNWTRNREIICGAKGRFS